MFTTFFRFELRFWLRAMMVWVFLAIIALMFLGATSSDNVQVGSATPKNVMRNAPFIVQQNYVFASLLAEIMVAAFVAGAATRDFAYDTHQIIFSKPLRKLGYLLGRFWGSTLVAVIPLLGVTVGMMLAKYAWWADADRFAATSWAAHFWGVVAYAIPNVILIAALVFAIATWTRSTVASFIGVILILVGYGVSQAFVGKLENETLTMMLDPFGIRCFSTLTKYWTVADKNSNVLMLSGVLLANRVVWLLFSMLVLAFACWRFQFATKSSLAKLRSLVPIGDESQSNTTVSLPKVDYVYGPATTLRQLWSQIKIDFWGTIKSSVFLVIMLAALANTIPSLFFAAKQGFGLSALPVTYNMVDLIRGAMYLFLLAIMTFYAGVLVWKERESRLDEVYDAAPQPTWIAYTGKLISLLLIIAMIQCVSIVAAIASQLYHGYDRIQLSLYVTEMLGIDFVSFFCLSVLAFVSHIVSPNKYVGYFLFIGLVIANAFGWSLAKIETRMVSFSDIPSYIYSDMYGFAPFVSGILGYSVYWILFSLLLSVGAILYWQRGRETTVGNRLSMAVGRWQGAIRVASIALLIAWGGCAAWVYYNTQVINEITSSDETEQLRADYEKQFKSDHEKAIQPKIVDVKYNIDLFPAERRMVMRGEQVLENKSDQPIDEIYVATSDDYETEFEIENAKLEEEYEDFSYFIYRFDPPMAPGDKANMTFTVSYQTEGFEDSVSNTSIVQNGSFFNNQIAPQIGYRKEYELSDKHDREDHDLGEPELMPKFDPENLDARKFTYISNVSDWLNVETVISTSKDQIAVAPGSLLKTWEEGDRRYFHYKVDRPSLNFYSFVSAEYEVAVRQWNDVDIEVYYHPEHRWNVDNMLRSIRMSLEYYTENFGPYMHKQARIIEFPRVATFAQAFPGTMPYSEGIGFIADISEEDDIDMVYYVVAHEMAHQWWAHQVIGANMQGATVLSETLAQYSALMVMEKEYGRDMMRKFLKYEMDQYLRSRGSETLAEQPLMKVEATQGYIHYRKGSVVMYYLKELIGEEKVNAALRSLVDKFAYQSEPYPTSADLIGALKEQTPEEYMYLYDDLFETITLFANRTLEATCEERADGTFEVTMQVECKKLQADEEGNEAEIEIDDWIEIGAFAKPEKDKKYGKTLYRDRVRVTQTDNTFSFVVEERPEVVGVDPFALLIDRMPRDNMKKPEFIEYKSSDDVAIANPL